MSVFHQAVLCKRSLLVSLGGFDVGLKTAMDYDLWVRLIVGGHQPQLSSVFVSRFYQGGTSGDPLANVICERAIWNKHGLKNSG